MVPAGGPVDQTIEALIPHMSRGDVILDGGNSNYKDTVRRAAALKPQGLSLPILPPPHGLPGAGSQS